eukprot:5625187-Amphidinium_carterae.1
MFEHASQLKIVLDATHALRIRSQYSLTANVATALRKIVGIMMGRMASVVVSLRSATVALVLRRRSTMGGRSSDKKRVQSTSLMCGCCASARKLSCDHPLASRQRHTCWRRQPGR